MRSVPSSTATMREPSSTIDGYLLRRLDVAEAKTHGDRLRDIFRMAVVAAAPGLYSPEQVVAWAGSADALDRWTSRFSDGMTWIATTRDLPDRPIGFAMRLPADCLDLLFVDPAFHRRGLGGALLAAVADEARGEGVTALCAEASLISYPLFVVQGYELVAWEEVEHRGLTFRRARMRKPL